MCVYFPLGRKEIPTWIFDSLITKVLDPLLASLSSSTVVCPYFGTRLGMTSSFTSFVPRDDERGDLNVRRRSKNVPDFG